MTGWTTKFKNRMHAFERMFKQKRINFRTIYKGDLRLFLDENSRFRLYYKDNEITKVSGLNTNILSEANWHSSLDAIVSDIERPSSEEMIIYLKHSQLSLIEIWYLKYSSEDMLSWEVDMHIKEPLRIDHMKASLFLSKAYEDWIIPSKQSTFPSFSNSQWQDMNSFEDKAGFIGLASSLEEFPSVSLKSCNNSKASLVIQNTDINLSSRVLEIQCEDKKEFYQPGVYPFLKATIQFYPDKNVLKNILKEIKDEEQKRLQELERLRQEEERLRQDEEQKKQEQLRLQEEERLKKAKEEDHKLRTLQSGPFKLHIDQHNRFHIYYKEQELTKGVGINIGILSEGNWYAACNSRIEIKRPSPNKMLVQFIHNKLPITYLWQIDFKPEGMFTWDIDISFKESLRIDRSNVSLFLSKSYDNWISPPEEGSFGFSFGPEWQRMNTRKDNAEFIGLYSSSEEFPDIICKSSKDSKVSLVIQNTDINLSSRVLEIQCEDKKEFYQPGVYPFLKATIQFYPDKNVLKNILKEIKDEERKKQDEEQKRLQELERLRQEEERLRQDEERKKQDEEQKRLQELERLRQEEERLRQDEEQKKQEQLRLQEEERLKKAKEEDHKLRTLQSGPFKLHIDQHNRFHIYYKEQELTKGVGINIGILSEGNWYAACNSRIEIKRPSPNKMLVQFIHNKLPITYLWQIDFNPEGMFIWNIDISFKEPLRIDQSNAYLFLSKSYNSWVASPQYGSFPSSFGPQWQRMNVYNSNNSEFIGLYSTLKEFPSILYKNSKDSNTLLAIQNSDTNLSSRVLEIQLEDNKEFYQPGTYSFLKASFQIYPDKTVLEGVLSKIRQEEERKKQEEEKKLKEQELKRLEEEQKKQELEKEQLKEERIRQEEERKKQEEEKKLKEQELKRLEEERERHKEERRKQEQEWRRQEETSKRHEEERKILEEAHKKQKEEEDRLEREHKRQEEQQKNNEEKLKKLQEKIKRIYMKPGETAEIVTFKEDYIKKDDSIYIYGDNEDLHDKISSKQGDFKKSISEIKTNINKNIKIGITMFNFFKLNEIAQFCSSLMNQRLDLRSVVLNPLPLKKFYLNFFDYIRELNERIGSDRIEFFLKDEKLLSLLYSISSQANQYNERELLRLLGVISEHSYIGPQTIVLDTYHRCNTNCIHCWIHTPKRNLSPELMNLKMELSLYKNIIDDAVSLLSDEIIIQGDGEPLLDDRFLEMVEYARNKGLKVIFFTNAILLDEKKARRITELEIDEIYCSLPAGTDKTYTMINSKQSKETFHKIAANLKNFISLRNKLKRNKPRLQMTHVIHDLNYHELEEMARLDAYIGADRARFYLARLDKNIECLKIKPNHIEIMKKSLKNITPYLEKEHIELQNNIWFQLKNYNSRTGRWSGDKFLKSGCPVGWFFCLILAKGELSMCCHLRIVDFLGDKSFKEAWNSEAYNKFRNQAKHIMRNKDVVFCNNIKLYDEYCNNCDTHQVILRIKELLKKYNLEQFYKGAVI